MNKVKAMKKNKNFYCGIVLNLIEGILAGFNFMFIYIVIAQLWKNSLDMKTILKFTSILVGIFILRLIIYIFGYTEGQIGGAKVSKAIRIALGNKLKNIPLSSFTKKQTGEYINVVTSDVNNYELILTHKVGDIVKNLTLSIMITLFTGTLFLPAGCLFFFDLLLLVPTMYFSFKMVKKYGSEKSHILADNVSNMTEYIMGIQTLRAYGVGGTKNKKVTESMKAYSNISYVYEKKVIPIGTVYGILTWLALPIIIFLASKAFFSGLIDAPEFIIVSILPIFACKLFGALFIDFTSYKNLKISKNNINNVLNEKEEIKMDKQLVVNKWDIEFKDVDFSYVNDETILENLNLSIPNQKLTAIVGDSGSGKSTILNLIAKFYPAHKGIVSIGGEDINNYDAEKVLNLISMVDQDVFLFNDTVRNNIRYAKMDTTDKEIEEACKLANCDEFIQNLENGYDTIIGENGGQLSGGERQRISIARALVKDSPIILLDEATASLDIENEIKVKKAIKNLLNAKKTVVMVAHTLSIVQKADKIIVISNGKVAEEGTHGQLLKKKGKYFHMWNAEQNLI